MTEEEGRLRFTLTGDLYGEDSFTYEVSDGNGGAATATVHVSIDAVDDAPVAADDAVEVDEDGTVLVDVLANDTDPDGDTLSIRGFVQAAHGTVAQEDDSLRYTPDAG